MLVLKNIRRLMIIPCFLSFIFFFFPLSIFFFVLLHTNILCVIERNSDINYVTLLLPFYSEVGIKEKVGMYYKKK